MSTSRAEAISFRMISRRKIILDNQIYEQVKYFDYSACSKHHERYNDVSNSIHYSETRKGALQAKYKNYKHLLNYYIAATKTNAFKSTYFQQKNK
jgi:hypothetical protein